jgi:uncharacterized NAD(P)/FAD-binding protein YdhS
MAFGMTDARAAPQIRTHEACNELLDKLAADGGVEITARDLLAIAQDGEYAAVT